MIDKKATTIKEAVQYLTDISSVIGSLRGISREQRKKFIEAQEFIYAAVCSLRKGLDKKDVQEEKDETGE